MYQNKLWFNAMNKLLEDKSKANINDIRIIDEFIYKYEKGIPEGIIYQIVRDLRFYKKYDAIAMWVGDGGLIENEPEFITELVGLFGVKE